MLCSLYVSGHSSAVCHLRICQISVSVFKDYTDKNLGHLCGKWNFLFEILDPFNLQMAKLQIEQQVRSSPLDS